MQRIKGEKNPSINSSLALIIIPLPKFSGAGLPILRGFDPEKVERTDALQAASSTQASRY